MHRKTQKIKLKEKKKSFKEKAEMVEMSIKISNRTKKLLSVLLLPVPGGNFFLNLLVKEKVNLPPSYVRWMICQAIKRQPERARIYLFNRIFNRMNLPPEQRTPTPREIFLEVKNSNLTDDIKAQIIENIKKLHADKQFKFTVRANPLNHLVEEENRLKGLRALKSKLT